MSEMTVAAAIAAACTRPVLTSKARQLAQDAIIDTLGCMVAGRNDDATQTVLRAFGGLNEGESGRLITGGRASPSVAALINGTAAHALDYDDNFTPGMSHASAVIVPAILALADFHKISGASLIDAYLAGLQAQALIGNGLGQQHYTAGWHGTSTVGSVGTAAATAKILGLDEDLTAEALRIAVSYASGTKGQFGTMIKPYHAGLASRNAVEAALLVNAGMRAKSDIFEGEQGLLELFSSDPRPGWDCDAILAEDQHIIETVGVTPKRHPCCGSTHMIIDTLLDLQDEHGFTGDEVKTVDALVGIANYRNLAYDKPANEMQARFSMQYCVARILRQGYLALADFTPAAVEKHANDPLIEKVLMRSRTVQEEREAKSRLPHIVTVELNDGRQFKSQRVFAVGVNSEPFSDIDRAQKFADCCQHLSKHQQVYGELCALDKLQDLSVLDHLFSGYH